MSSAHDLKGKRKPLRDFEAQAHRRQQERRRDQFSTLSLNLLRDAVKRPPTKAKDSIGLIGRVRTETAEFVVGAPAFMRGKERLSAP
jgi:hypothetical protein